MNLILDNDEAFLVYKALASETRIEILKILSRNPSTVSQISKDLGYSKAIISRYMRLLEEAKLIKQHHSDDIDKDNRKKSYILAVDRIDIEFPKKLFLPLEKEINDIKLGYYSDFDIKPTCGLASAAENIGDIDDPRTFASNDRVNADLLWFSEGYVKYIIPNTIKSNFRPELIEFSLEISSEFPGSNNVWPSDIAFFINDIYIGSVTIPGNFSDVRGKYTPDYWPDWLSQYGLLKFIRVNHEDTSINGIKISDVTISDLKLEDNPFVSLKISVEDDSKNKGGLTIFGENFGNHKQNIQYTIYYSKGS